VELILLHVAPPPSALVANPPRVLTTAWGTPLYVSERDAARARHPIYVTQVEASLGAHLVSQMRPEAQELEEAGYEVRITVRFGDPATAIVAAIVEEGATLVAMATHGRTGLIHLLLGSVAEQVLRQSRVPVLLVRPQADS